MSGLVRLASVSVALWGGLTLTDLRQHTSGVVLWPLKVIATAAAPLTALAGGLLALLGLRRRDLSIAVTAALGAAAAAHYTARAMAPHDGFERAFGADWQARVSPAQRSRFLRRRWTPLLLAHPPASVQRNVVYGRHPGVDQPLLADLWQPPAGALRSGLGVIYVHGGAWRVGEKDMGTRALFRRLVGQGHVVMDINYTLAPTSDIAGMVQDVKRALIWLKQHAATYDVDPQRIVLMGGSAGGHLALLAAFTPNDPQLQPDGSAADTSVRAVVAFYPPTDLREIYADGEALRQRLQRRRHIPLYASLIEALLRGAGLLPPAAGTGASQGFMAWLMGGTPDERPDLYRALSPIERAGPHCPPTLLLQGTADIFGMGPSVQRLYQRLVEAGVPAVLVQFPYTDHAFDLVLPQVSPAAQAALYDVERFLALVSANGKR
ncbi:MAG: alpha/beta hydrolase [Anaerolineae bacterium]|nr:alpha/beta hydrolase [Anaerolineae bacterium]